MGSGVAILCDAFWWRVLGVVVVRCLVGVVYDWLVF